MKKSGRRDLNQLAKSIVDLATTERTTINVMNVHAVELGRLGGLKGGRARAKKLSKARRVKIAQSAARARWRKKP